jgi:type II secretory pathway pseudopilin PulG
MLKVSRISSQTTRADHFGSDFQSRLGMTLVEVLLAATIFLTVSLGITLSFIQSYKMAALTRYQDAAKNVLSAYATQFQRLEYLVVDPANPPAVVVQTLFTTVTDAGGTPAESSTGLSIMQNGVVITDGIVSLDSGTGGTVTGTVTRVVYPVDEVTGLYASGAVPTTAGLLLHGRFIIRFNFGSKPYTQQIITLRNVP